MSSRTTATARASGIDSDDAVISDDLLGQLYRAGDKVTEIVAGFSPRRRARLAAFCYGRAHLHAIGLTIASTCDLVTLTQVMGRAAGRIVFDQSHERMAQQAQAAGARRHGNVTLATFTPSARRIIDIDVDEPVAETDDGELALPIAS
jgi:hypothetical protein